MEIWEESKVLKQLSRQREPFKHLRQLLLLLLIVEWNQLHFLEHFTVVERNVLLLAEVRLENIYEGLQNHSFDMITRDSAVVAVQNVIQPFVFVFR